MRTDKSHEIELGLSDGKIHSFIYSVFSPFDMIPSSYLQPISLSPVVIRYCSSMRIQLLTRQGLSSLNFHSNGGEKEKCGEGSS